MKKYDEAASGRLFRAIASIQTEEECRAFFEDVCTIKEIVDMAQRFDTALLLNSGCNYQEICERVGVSTATISRVSRCLNYGDGGYKRIIDRVGGEADLDEI
ncbi:MAG: TrpR-related protein YerC/YecD [Clostridia bacterium]|nr:TrpR-related protein YerC/YecD [Clostridia bacterium]